MKNFKLKQLRLEKGLKQTELAEIFNKTVLQYQRWEYGTSKPRYNDLIKLAQFFNVSIDYLVGLDDVPNRKNK